LITVDPSTTFIYSPRRIYAEHDLILADLKLLRSNQASSYLIRLLIIFKTLNNLILLYYREAINAFTNGKKSVPGIVKRTSSGGQNGNPAHKSTPTAHSATKAKPTATKYIPAIHNLLSL